MKKLSYLFAALIMAAALFSCEQDNNDMVVLKKGDAVTTVSSASGVVPVIIPGANNGGNVTCDEVAAAFDLPEGYFLCGERIDYSGGTFGGEFPDGLDVEVTGGKYVSFKLDAPIVIGDVNYVVGAVIVKGGNAANVYYYPGGILEDSNLCSPVNASGKPAGLSNLTICLMKQLPELVINLKTYLTPSTAQNIEWAGIRGVGSDVNSLHLGYVTYNYGSSNFYPLYLGKWGGSIGTVTVRDYFEEGLHYLEIKIEFDEVGRLFYDVFIYVGSKEGYAGYLILEDGIYYSQFHSFPFLYPSTTGAESRTFKIEFSQIIL